MVLLLFNRAGDLLIPLAGTDVSELFVYAFLIGHQLIADGFRVAYTVLAVSLRQVLLPPAVLGRANALFQLSENGMLLAGTLSAGVIATVIGIESAVWLGMLGGLIGPLLLLPLLRQKQKLDGR